MPTYTKETALYDTGALASDIASAGETASKYITRIGSNGVSVHAEENPTTNYTKIDGTGMEVYQNVNGTATKVASFGSSGAQIGRNGAAHSVIDTNGQRFYTVNGNNEIQLANIGFGEGATTTGTTNAPYYSFGIRQSSGAIGAYSVLEGSGIASGAYSHAEGAGTLAEGHYSHAEGHNSEANDYGAHAEGTEAKAIGEDSHAQNIGTRAEKHAQTVLGSYNEPDTSTTTTHPSGHAEYGKYAIILGNGRAGNLRSNALTVDWNGNVTASGQIVGATDSVTPTISSITTGSLTGRALYVNGKWAQLNIVFQKSTVTAAGANVFVGTLESQYRPINTVRGATFYGSNAIVGALTTDGTITVRNTGSQLAATTGSNTIGMTFTYLMA